jgi:hypothetical protein
VGELRERGLFVDLGAYECLVLDDLREVVSTAEQPWAELAAVLGGRAVLSLDDALADHRLRPVHAAIGRLLVAMTGEEIVAARTGLGSIAGVPLPSQASKPPSGRRAARRATDPAARAVDRLRPLTRARFDELRIGTPLRLAGLAADAIDRVRVGLELPTPSTIGDPSALAERWLSDPDVRAFLQVHEWDGVEWLVRDRWVALVDLAVGFDELAGSAVPAAATRRLRTAAEAAVDRVDAIVPALASRAGVRPTPKVRNTSPTGVPRRRTRGDGPAAS